MSLTLSQRSSIRLYLGYPDVYRYKDTRLESVFESISDEAEALIVSALASITTVEAQIAAVQAAAGLKRVDDIWFQDGQSMLNGLRRQGRQYVSRISITLGVTVYSDVFGVAGYLGDAYSGAPQSGRGGGFFNLG